MGKVQISARIDTSLKNALERYCKSRGVIMNHFIQEALLDRLEELEDIEDLKRIRHESTRPLAELLAELKLNARRTRGRRLSRTDRQAGPYRENAPVYAFGRGGA